MNYKKLSFQQIFVYEIQFNVTYSDSIQCPNTGLHGIYHKYSFYEFKRFLQVTILFKPSQKNTFLGTLQVYKLKIGTQTDSTHSNDYCIIHFNSYKHSKITQEQKVSKFCMYSNIRLTCVPAVVYIPLLVDSDALCKQPVVLQLLVIQYCTATVWRATV